MAGIKDRTTGKIAAQKVAKTDAPTLQGFVEDRTTDNAKIYTDDAAAYKGMNRGHEAVRHSVGEYVREMAHTNGLESFRATLKRGYQGTFHHFSAKHMNRYISEFARRHNIRDMDTIDMMAHIAQEFRGKRLTYEELIGA